MTAKLIVSDGQTERELLLVGNLVVGRDPICDISGDDVLLSRRHAEFIVGGNGIHVQDLGSRNGVYLNGKKVAEAKLSSGDVLGIGHLQIQFIEDAAPLSSVLAATSPVPHPVAAPSMPPPDAPAASAPARVPEADDEELTRFVGAPGSKPSAPSPPPRAVPSDDETRFVPPPSAPRAPAVPAAAPAHATDDDSTRIVTPPRPSAAAPKAAPVKPRVTPAGHDDYDETRFVPAPAKPPAPPTTQKSSTPVAAAPLPPAKSRDLPPPAPPPVAVVPPPAVEARSTPTPAARVLSAPVNDTEPDAPSAAAGLSSGAVFGHVALLALIVAAAVAAAFMSGGGGAADNAGLIWFAGAAVVSLAATLAIGASLNRRIARSSAAVGTTRQAAAHARDRVAR